MSEVTHFGSDNHSGVHPHILKAIADHNRGHAPSYGTDDYTLEVLQKLKSHFSNTSEIYFVFNGTAANVICLACTTQSYQSVITADTAHIWMDECGAPEKLLGAKLITLPSRDGKMTVEQIKQYVVRRGDQHYSQVSCVSITQPTEYGTVYSLEEMQEISRYVHSEGLYLHVDGARLVNAATHLNVSLKELIVDTGVDVLSFGGTKNGLLFGEAVVVLNPKLGANLKYVRKQFMQLPSKTRFVAAQFDAWINTGLWKEISKHSLEMAKYLRARLENIHDVRITQETQSNVVFAILPKKIVHELKKHHFFYIWDEKTFEARIMTTWDTRREDIDRFAAKIQELITHTHV